MANLFATAALVVNWNRITSNRSNVSPGIFRVAEAPAPGVISDTCWRHSRSYHMVHASASRARWRSGIVIDFWKHDTQAQSRARERTDNGYGRRAINIMIDRENDNRRHTPESNEGTGYRSKVCSQ